MAEALTVDRLRAADIVGIAQCAAIDADAFPYASAVFGERSPRGAVLVARGPAIGPVLGFLAGRVRHRALDVMGVAVRRDHRRRGIARALLRAAIDRAREAELDEVRLCVSVTNRGAIALYEAEGLVAVARRRGYYPAHVYGDSGDALEMRRRLRASTGRPPERA